MCAMLHNIAKRRGVPMPPGIPDVDQHQDGDLHQPIQNNRPVAQAMRQAFINEHFG